MTEIQQRAILREALAAATHYRWITWSKDIANSEDISKARLKRWKELWKTPYPELTDEMKELDRREADQVLKVLDALKEEKADELTSAMLQ